MLRPSPQISIDPSDYLYVARIVANQYRFGREKVEDTDVYSVCCEELVKIASDYSGDDFPKYAYAILKNAVKDHFKYNTRKKRHCSHQQLPEDISEIQKQNRIPIDLLDTFLAKHPDDTEQDVQDKKLLVDFYLNQIKIPKICQQLNVSKTIVYSRIKRITSKLKDRYSSLIESFCDE